MAQYEGRLGNSEIMKQRTRKEENEMVWHETDTVMGGNVGVKSGWLGTSSA